MGALVNSSSTVMGNESRITISHPLQFLSLDIIKTVAFDDPSKNKIERLEQNNFVKDVIIACLKMTSLFVCRWTRLPPDGSKHLFPNYAVAFGFN